MRSCVSDQDLRTQIWGENDGHDPGNNQRQPDNPKNVAGILAGCRLGEADGQKASSRYECTCQHGECCRLPGERGSAQSVETLSDFHDHHLYGDDGIIDQEPKRNNEGAQGDPVEIHAVRKHDDEYDCQNERNGQRHHNAGTKAEREKTDDENDRQRLSERNEEFANRILNDARLIGDLLYLNAKRDIRPDVSDGRLKVLPEFQDICIFGHGDRHAHGRLAAMRDQKGRGILITSPYVGNVAQPKSLAVGFDRYGANSIFTCEGAADADFDAIGIGIDCAGRRHHILFADGIEDRLGRNAEGCELTIAYFNKNTLGHIPDQDDLRHVRHAQKRPAQCFRLPLEIGPHRTVASQHVDGREDVAVLVVEERPYNPLGQFDAAVAELFSDLIPCLRCRAATRAVLQLYLQNGLPRTRVCAHVVQFRHFLQPLLQWLGNEALHIVRCGPWPDGLNHHRLDSEVRIFGPAEVEVGPDPTEASGDNEKQHNRRISDRNLGEIEFHLGLSHRRTRRICCRSGIVLQRRQPLRRAGSSCQVRGEIALL